MLTKEQIKNLKEGDKLLAEVSFCSVCKDNDLICNALFTNYIGDIMCSGIPYHPSCLTLPPTKPKHDPCRKFRKGDIVKPCSVNGRWSSHTWEDRSGMHFEVVKDEDPLTAHMELKDPDRPQTFLVHAAFFKLVTPVEEQEPYYVVENPTAWGVYIKKEKMGEVLASGYSKQFHPAPEKEARAECDRLNAEYGKEQQ